MKKLRVWDRGKESSVNDWTRISLKIVEFNTQMYPLSHTPTLFFSTADYTVQITILFLGILS
jgi:hypothetical protein